MDPLTFRVLLAPVELGPYGKHRAYAKPTSTPHAPRYILANRFICRWDQDSIVLAVDEQLMTDVLVHEMTHHRQAMLRDRALRKRGDHRDPGWWGAIAEAAPRYLGVRFDEDVWPMQKTKPGRLTEVEACHWPMSFRKLIAAGDPRLQSSVHDQAPVEFAPPLWQ